MAEVNEKKDEKQSEGTFAWLDSARKNTAILGTGTGKSKVAINILEELFLEKTLNANSKILLLTNSENLRDTNWKEEFSKWGAMDIYKQITSECYQTVHKWKDTTWDFVIADEIDFSLTPEYQKFYQNNSYEMLLGLTGFVDSSKDAILASIAPVVIEYSTQQAQEDGLLNKTQIVFVEYELSKNSKDMEVKYKDSFKQDKSFFQSENDAYEYVENTCNITWGKISYIENKAWRGLTSDETAELNKLKYKSRKAIMDRKKLLFNGIASAKVAKALINKILSRETNKVISFSMLTEQSEKFQDVTFNGKNKKGNSALEDISSGIVKSLGVCKAIDRGINLVGINNLILESYEGSTTAFAQRNGRGCRLKPEDTMYLYIMLPYYHKKVASKDVPGTKVSVKAPTQMCKWAEAMLAEFNYSNSIRIKYDERSNDFISC